MKRKKILYLLFSIIILIIFFFFIVKNHSNIKNKFPNETLETYKRMALNKKTKCIDIDESGIPEYFEFVSKDSSYPKFYVCRYYYKSKDDGLNIKTETYTLQEKLTHITPSKASIKVIKKFNYLDEYGKVGTDCRMDDCGYHLFYSYKGRLLTIETGEERLSDPNELISLLKNILPIEEGNNNNVNLE